MIGAAVYNILSNASGVTALVSTRLYPTVAPQNTTLPFIVYSEITAVPTDIKSGVSPVDLITIQFDVYDTTALSVEGIEEALRAALDRITPGTYASIAVDGCIFKSRQSMYESDAELHRKSIDYQFRIKR